MPPNPPSESVAGDPGGEILPQVARARIVSDVAKAKEPEFEAAGYLAKARGVFVTLRISETGELRGCMGSLEPKTENLVEETRLNAHAAAFEDKRFKPLKKKELDEVKIEVSVLGELERVDSIAELDPEVYGVVLTSRKSGKRGVMLPDVPGLNTVDKQLAAIRRKADLRPDESLKIERFRVEKYLES